MKIHRFIEDYDFTQPRITITDSDVVRQIKNVLKLKKGELVILCNGRMEEAQARIVAVGLGGVEVEVIKLQRNMGEPQIETILFCAILKKENFDLVVQKATEVGVTEIFPVVSLRTVKTGVNRDRLERIAREAAEQCGRGIVPLIHEEVDFKEALRIAAPNHANYFFELGAPLFDKGVLKMKGVNRVGVFIGTEGGWDESEVELARKNYFHLASLGPLTMRAETAAVIATYLITSTYL